MGWICTYRYAQSSPSSPPLSCQSQKLVVQSPVRTVLQTWERRRTTVQCKRGYRRRKWNKAFNKFLRSWGAGQGRKQPELGQLPQQIRHRSTGSMFGPFKKIRLHFSLIFWGKKISWCYPCLYLHCTLPWQKIWNALVWAVWEFPWRRYEDFPHS